MDSKPNDEQWQALPGTAQLQNGGSAIRFEVAQGGRTVPAFAIQFDGTVYAYLNQCAHVAMEMDWQAGQFFDFDQRWIMCATHGALYAPSTGLCIDGPCAGKYLTRVELHHDNGIIYAPRTL
jgi:nitrite reductase/ring-hydroxylating ferredoxin subunit